MVLVKGILFWISDVRIYHVLLDVLAVCTGIRFNQAFIAFSLEVAQVPIEKIRVMDNSQVLAGTADKGILYSRP